MSLLYKDLKDLVYTVDIEQNDNKVKLNFYADAGKHGTEEHIDEYELTVRELLLILQLNREDD